MTHWLLGSETNKAFLNGDLDGVVEALTDGNGKLGILGSNPSPSAMQDLFAGWSECLYIEPHVYADIQLRMVIPEVHLVYACDCRHERKWLLGVAAHKSVILDICKAFARKSGWELSEQHITHLKDMNQTQCMCDEQYTHEFIVETEVLNHG